MCVRACVCARTRVHLCMYARACVRARVYVLANLFVQIMTVTVTTTEKETITDGMWTTTEKETITDGMWTTPPPHPPLHSDPFNC